MDKMLEGAIKVLNRINNASYEAYIVGGYTRDYLLNKPSNDIDITTEASPDIIEKLFPDHFNKSLKYRTITVRVDGYEYEVTTYRKDLKYKDHRHTNTKYAKKLEYDVIRRDFTINALCMDKDLTIRDLVGGTRDLDNKIIRAIGNPISRFTEDALRMFRAFRFASRFMFSIDFKTFKAIKLCSHLTQYLSKERIRDELEKIVCEEYFFNYIKLIIDSKILKHLPYTERAIRLLYLNYKSIDILDLIVIASFIKGELADEIMISKKEERFIEDTLFILNKIKERKLSKLDLINIEENCIYSALKISDILFINAYSLSDIENMIKKSNIRYSKELCINGTDIKKEFNLEDSPLIGEYINKALKLVVIDGIGNTKEEVFRALKLEVNHE